MSQQYTKGFKIQAVEKALNRSPEITLVKMAETLGVSRSALQRWIAQSKNHELETSRSPIGVFQASCRLKLDSLYDPFWISDIFKISIVENETAAATAAYTMQMQSYEIYTKE